MIATIQTVRFNKPVVVKQSMHQQLINLINDFCKSVSWVEPADLLQFHVHKVKKNIEQYIAKEINNMKY